MSDIEELPSWASRAVQPGSAVPGNDIPVVPPAPPPPRRRRWPVLLLGLLVLALLAGGGYAIANNRGDSPVASGGGAAAPSTIASATTSAATSGGGQVAGGASSTTQATTSTTAPTTTTSAAPSTTTTAATAMAKGTVTADNPEGALRYAVFKGGQVHLRGKVPAEAVGKEIETRAGKVLGPPNVFNEYQIDPTAPIDTPAPLYVEDVVLFGFNSVTIEPAFTPLLDLGTKLMTIVPTARIKVVASTDSVGTPEANLRVSQQRAQAVIDYWVRKGIDPSRLSADPRGEQGSTATDDPQTAALRRRAEFIISGFLG